MPEVCRVRIESVQTRLAKVAPLHVKPPGPRAPSPERGLLCWLGDEYPMGTLHSACENGQVGTRLLHGIQSLLLNLCLITRLKLQVSTVCRTGQCNSKRPRLFSSYDTWSVQPGVTNSSNAVTPMGLLEPRTSSHSETHPSWVQNSDRPLSAAGHPDLEKPSRSDDTATAPPPIRHPS